VSILVFIEQREGKVRGVAHELLGEAQRLVAAGIPGPVVGVCCAASDPGLASLGAAGADEVKLAANAAFALYDASGYAAAVVAAAAPDGAAGEEDSAASVAVAVVAGTVGRMKRASARWRPFAISSTRRSA